MTSKKSKKGKTIPLTEYLADEPKLVTVRTSNWAEIVEKEEAETRPIVIDIGGLPSAPRSAVDIDYSTVPNNPPFVAHVANLSFEINDENLRRIFGDLDPKSARIIRNGNRSRGLGLVEFETRENLIQALKRSEKEIYGRKMRVTVSEKTDSQLDNSRIGTEERPEMAERWRRAEPRSNETSGDRLGSRSNRIDFDQSSMSGSSRDNQSATDYGYGYPRSRDARGGGAVSRNYNRQGPRNRYQDEPNRSNSRTGRPRYGGRYSDTRDTRDRRLINDDTNDAQQEPPRERQRLQLQPRTKPLEDSKQLSGSSSSMSNVGGDVDQSSKSYPDESYSSITNQSNQKVQSPSINENQDEYQQQKSNDSTGDNSQINTFDEQSTAKPSRGAGASIFGGAKPVDTAAREFEIERKLKEMELANRETAGENENKISSSKPSYSRGGERDIYRDQRSSQNDDRRDRRDDGRSGHGRDYHYRRDNAEGRSIDDDGRRRNDDHHRRGGRGGGYDRDRYTGSSRRDYESGRIGKTNYSERDNERGNYRHRDRNYDTNENNSSGRSTNNNFNADSQTRNQQRGTTRMTVQTEDYSNRLELSNKFGLLEDHEPDDDNESDDAQSSTVDD